MQMRESIAVNKVGPALRLILTFSSVASADTMTTLVPHIKYLSFCGNESTDVKYAVRSFFCSSLHEASGRLIDLPQLYFHLFDFLTTNGGY